MSSKMCSVNVCEFFVEKCDAYHHTPCNSPVDYEIAESINSEMEIIRRDFQAKMETTRQMCASFRFSRF